MNRVLPFYSKFCSGSAGQRCRPRSYRRCMMRRWRCGQLWRSRCHAHLGRVSTMAPTVVPTHKKRRLARLSILNLARDLRWDRLKVRAPHSLLPTPQAERAAVLGRQIEEAREVQARLKAERAKGLQRLKVPIPAPFINVFRHANCHLTHLCDVTLFGMDGGGAGAGGGERQCAAHRQPAPLFARGAGRLRARSGRCGRG